MGKKKRIKQEKQTKNEACINGGIEAKSEEIS